MPAEQLTAAQHMINSTVMRVCDVDGEPLFALLRCHGLQPQLIADDGIIPGSYWGEREAGLIEARLYFRDDTPLHSLLHEACHYICMDASRRLSLSKDAGGDHAEENAVCYLQILLADHVDGFGRQRMLADMDTWGYTFRLGSARLWFEQDAEDARDWLMREGLITEAHQPTWQTRC